ncbi:GNAT family N-acetyltransferase [Hyphomonas sp.]|jgi:GNAT superfamily N-acetyltransferase|uniref:GNAT family N-acetyltransferase n=1 Tax=Hyphomonas sp. TaxID=87 RepID=UPI0025C22D67|nr:GNAT family N-acetyltransferase [Hyphomonas sp.]
MLPDLTIHPLRDCAEALAPLAIAFRSEWPNWYGPGGPGDAGADLAAFANPQGVLPVGLVALDAHGVPLGTATLKAAWTPEFAHLTPWASAGWVRPDLRRHGLGALLVRALAGEARRLGHSHLYCATATAITLLEREGWTDHAQTVHDGHIIRVFQRAL